MFCSQTHQYSNAQQILWVYHRDFRNPLKKSPQLPWPNPPPQTFTCGSHKACLSQKKSVYSALAKITKDLQTLTIEQQGYFENSKCCFRCKMKWISPVQQCSHPPTQKQQTGWFSLFSAFTFRQDSSRHYSKITGLI